MEELEKQRVCVKFCCKLGKHFTETFQLLNQWGTMEDEERVSSTKKKKNKDESVKDQGDIGCSF
jgi:hypothetical protein